MKVLFAAVMVAIYLWSWVYYTKFQIEERRLPDAEEHTNLESSKKWHKYKFINQVSFFGMTALSVGIINALILSLFYWVLFDALTAKIVLGKPYYYINDTTVIDKFFKNKISQKIFFFIRAGVCLGLLLTKILL